MVRTLYTLSHQSIYINTEQDDDLECDEGPILIDDDDDDVQILSGARSPSPQLPEKIELECANLVCGVITAGDVVELHDESGRVSDHLACGDFLLVKYIKEELESGEVFLYGYRLIRTSSVAPLFNSMC
jgi:hypothetical protein